MYPAPGSEEQYPPAHKAYPPQPPPPAMGYPPAGGPALHVQSPATRPWSTGLCDCCDDAGNCCLTFCCPCVTFGRIAEIVDRGSTSCGASGALYALIMYLTGCGCAYSCFYRTKLRQQYGLPESPCNDCLVHCCCESCALCQEYRELRSRGFDMESGWYGNQDRRASAGETAPPAPQGGMAR